MLHYQLKHEVVVGIRLVIDRLCSLFLVVSLGVVLNGKARCRRVWTATVRTAGTALLAQRESTRAESAVLMVWCTGVHCHRWHSCCTCNCNVTTGWCFDVEFGQCLGRIIHSIRRTLMSAEVCDSVDIEYTCWTRRPGFAYSVLWPGSGFASIGRDSLSKTKHILILCCGVGSVSSTVVPVINPDFLFFFKP